MRTRFPAVISVILTFLLATCALAQVAKWDEVSYETWGFSAQVPAGAVKQSVPNQLVGGMCDLYSKDDLACYIRVTPTPDSQLASTAIEQIIQADVKSASKLGATKRWEQVSKQGDLFKGFVGPIKLDGGDMLQVGISTAIGSDSGIECVSMAPLGSETAPIVRIGVVGPASRQAEIVTTAKAIAALVKRTPAATPSVAAPEPAKLPAQPAPSPGQKPKPWPALKKGEIELEGKVESVAADRRTVSLTVDSIKLPGQDRIALTPPRTKQVHLKIKPGWLSAGLRVTLIGRNTGIGKPMTADAIRLETQ